MDKVNYDEMMNRFNQDRTAAFLSLDEGKIKSHYIKYGMKFPDDENLFWARVHKTILSMEGAPPELRTRSINWLKDKGYIKD